MLVRSCHWGIIIRTELTHLMISDIILYILNCIIHIFRGSKKPFLNTIHKLHFYDITNQVYLWGSNAFLFLLKLPAKIIPSCSFRIVTDYQGIISVHQNVFIVQGSITLLGRSHPYVQVIQAQGKVQMSNTISQMVSKVVSYALSAI